eukprot:scaffold14582_cov108-Isochrysis_galbana.AAC.3
MPAGRLHRAARAHADAIVRHLRHPRCRHARPRPTPSLPAHVPAPRAARPGGRVAQAAPARRDVLRSGRVGNASRPTRSAGESTAHHARRCDFDQA